MATKKAVKKPAKKVEPIKSKGGRPSLYIDEYAEQARKLCLLGATDKELADFFGVVEDTINEWKKVYPEFSLSIRTGKDIADAEVADKLYQRALGYSHPEVDIRVVAGEIVQTPIVRHYPPDTPAGIHWLNNRQKQKWRSKIDQEVSGPNGGPQQHEHNVAISAEEAYKKMLNG